MSDRKKLLGQFFTPSDVAQALVSWVVRDPSDRMLDPSCGDGEFIRCHKKSVGVEFDLDNAALARQRAPSALVHGGEFFKWAFSTKERFDAIAGNPPFIRYQSFKGDVRERALRAASSLGADFGGLSSSWAPFVLIAATLLKPGRRMAFVVPAEIGHASYSRPLLPTLCARFEKVHVAAYQEKLFPKLSEDCWLLFCEGAGGSCDRVHLSINGEFDKAVGVPNPTKEVTLHQWRAMGERLRPFLLPDNAISLYQELLSAPGVSRFGDLGKVGIGYVTGDNDFFHLRPSDAKKHKIPKEFLRVSVRKGEQLPDSVVDNETVSKWLAEDQPVLLLDLKAAKTLPKSVKNYLDAEAGQDARKAFKCRNRNPWYGVPDVKIPDAFVTVMAGKQPALVRNDAGCVCTNSLHGVFFRPQVSSEKVQSAWTSPLGLLGMEIEGHPLGGGMLKLEPKEAAKIPLPLQPLKTTRADKDVIVSAIETMRRWRHNE